MKSTFTLEQLATLAFNQLLSGTCLDEAYENLAIFDRLDLDDQQESQLRSMLEAKAAKLCMVLDDYLRPMTCLESLAHNTKTPLEAYTSQGYLIVQSDLACVRLALGMVPEVIATQRIPVSLMGLMAFVYFQAKEGA